MSVKRYCYDGSEKFKINKFDTRDKGKFGSREEAVEEFVSNLKEINKLQQKLYAARQEGVVFVFQAMDAAGKDGCIRTVFSTLTPHGVKEYCFKAPSAEELSHDYLWRFWSALPARGHISIFNRSYYEDVLIGKVHELYKNQIVPERMRNVDVIEKRYKEINDFEKYLYNNATRVVKIFLNVSKDEQAKRFISRIETPKKNWKVSEGDIKEREYWDEYQEAFETMVNKTASKKSPWYVVPADHKWYARLIVSRIVLATLREMDPQFPEVAREDMEKMVDYRDALIQTLPKKDREKLEAQTKLEPNDDYKNEIEGQLSFFELMDNEDKTIASEDVQALDELEENENLEDLKKIDEVDKNQIKESEEKKKNKQNKKHKKHKKKKKDKNHRIDVQEIMEDLDASTDNAFVDGSDVVVETILQEEAERAEEKAIMENSDNEYVTEDEEIHSNDDVTTDPDNTLANNSDQTQQATQGNDDLTIGNNQTEN